MVIDKVGQSLEVRDIIAYSTGRGSLHIGIIRSDIIENPNYIHRGKIPIIYISKENYFPNANIGDYNNVERCWSLIKTNIDTIEQYVKIDLTTIRNDEMLRIINYTLRLLESNSKIPKRVLMRELYE